MSEGRREWRGKRKRARAFMAAALLTFAISLGRSEAAEVPGRFPTPTPRIGACPGMIRSDCEADILEIPNTFDDEGPFVFEIIGDCDRPLDDPTWGVEPMCSEYCVGRKGDAEGRVYQVRGRGQIVTTGPSSVWTWGTLDGRGGSLMTQPGNRIVDTGRRCFLPIYAPRRGIMPKERR